MKNRVALVTGGANGIGQAIAIALAAQEFRIVLFDLADCSKTISKINSDGAQARMLMGNVSSESGIQKLFGSIADDEGQLDIAVNCAGLQLIRPLVETSIDDLNAVIEVNLKGTFLVGREAAKMMLRQSPGGRIINIASELAYTGRTNFSAYCATKGAIISLTRSWARELAPKILVNAVSPGPTDTAMVSLEQMTAEQIRFEINSVPLARIARPEEIAATVAFLAGPGGDYYTGQCLSPNGGAAMF